MLASFLGEHFLCAVIGPIALCEVPTNYCYGSLLGYAATPLASTTPRAKKLLLFLPSPSIFLFWACPRCFARGRAIRCYLLPWKRAKGYPLLSLTLACVLLCAKTCVVLLCFLFLVWQSRDCLLPRTKSALLKARAPDYAQQRQTTASREKHTCLAVKQPFAHYTIIF